MQQLRQQTSWKLKSYPRGFSINIQKFSERKAAWNEQRFILGKFEIIATGWALRQHEL
jgi:hypothetical protein